MEEVLIETKTELHGKEQLMGVAAFDHMILPKHSDSTRKELAKNKVN